MDSLIPFISNTPDDTQCLQASYAMIRLHFDRDLDITWDDWAEITGYLPGKGTWSMAGLIWFKEHGYDVVHLGRFDYGEFARRGADYLIESLGEEVAGWELKYMDLKIEQARALRFLESGVWVQKVPTIADIKAYLNDGYLVKCLVNMKALNGEEGYLGHAVVVKGYTDTEIIMHDPGLPARPNRRVDLETFMRAWTDPQSESEKMDAIRKLPTEPREDKLRSGPTLAISGTGEVRQETEPAASVPAVVPE